ncbi:hypothetical protein GCM10010298_44910 [Streptomyces microflavus]|nr:hypothetical protein GCM10010298_44910 [Streptomyces microflavus]
MDGHIEGRYVCVLTAEHHGSTPVVAEARAAREAARGAVRVWRVRIAPGDGEGGEVGRLGFSAGRGF